VSRESERAGVGQEAFEQIFRDCYGGVVRYATRRVGAEAVQDVVSETFLVAWRRRGELRGEPLPWLLGIARRVAANQRRAGLRREDLARRVQLEPTALSQSRGEPGVRDRQLAVALASLRERDREALLLVVWDGLEHREAAKVMGCTTGALTVRVHRARRRLARALADAGAERVQFHHEAELLR
jgi:RNA polymerase sigma-70 factor (ECF subfamily)